MSAISTELRWSLPENVILNTNFVVGGFRMKVLVIGSGGREHVISYKLSLSPRVTKLYCAPGNGGIASIAECVPIKATDIDQIVAFAKSESIDLVFVAPEDPLALGLVDRLREAQIRVFGPTAAAALIEASKAYSKDLMKRYNIPTARYEIFDSESKALAYLESQSMPIVIKADGLALGKGVIIAQTLDEAKEAVHSMFSEKKFGQAGDVVVIEECLNGPELTILAFADGETAIPMVSSRDHKRALDNDLGKNTGGMGAITPGADLSEEDELFINEKIIDATILALKQEGRPFEGVIYFGLMLTPEGPKVIEYNARFGDPEAQAILPRLRNDLLDIVDACIDHRLSEVVLDFKPGASCCVVMASGGYPDAYETGYEIFGIEESGCLVFQAGTKLVSGRPVTSGGRVLCVYAESKNLDDAIEKSYESVQKIHFNNAHYRTDIGRTGK